MKVLGTQIFLAISLTYMVKGHYNDIITCSKIWLGWHERFPSQGDKIFISVDSNEGSL